MGCDPPARVEFQLGIAGIPPSQSLCRNDEGGRKGAVARSLSRACCERSVAVTRDHAEIFEGGEGRKRMGCDPPARVEFQPGAAGIPPPQSLGRNDEGGGRKGAVARSLSRACCERSVAVTRDHAKIFEGGEGRKRMGCEPPARVEFRPGAAWIPPPQSLCRNDEGMVGFLRRSRRANLCSPIKKIFSDPLQSFSISVIRVLSSPLTSF